MYKFRGKKITYKYLSSCQLINNPRMLTYYLPLEKRSNDVLKDILKKKYGGERDFKIYMNEAEHVYYVEGEPLETSVTKVKGKFFPKFDQEKCLNKYIFKHKDSQGRSLSKNPKYKGKNRKEVLQAWKETSTLGTRMHECIEMYLNDQEDHPLGESITREERMEKLMAQDVDKSNSREELEQFIQFEEEFTHLQGWKVWMVERIIFDESISLGGSIDAIYRRPRRGYQEEDQEWEYCIVDWKRTPKNFKSVNFPENKGFYPLEEVSNCQLHTYGIQLYLYANILKRLYGMEISKCFLVQLSKENKRYKIHEVPNLEKEVEKMLLLHRRHQDIVEEKILPLCGLKE